MTQTPPRLFKFELHRCEDSSGEYSWWWAVRSPSGRCCFLSMRSWKTRRGAESAGRKDLTLLLERGWE